MMFRFITKASFLTGISIGVFLAVLLKINKTKTNTEPPSRLFEAQHYKKWFETTKLTRSSVLFDSVRYDNKTILLESDYLYKKINILCVILVKSSKNGKAIEDTWGKHCNELHLVSLNQNKKIQIRRNNNDSSWVILCKKLQELPESHWVLVAYDYTFVLLENLRLFAASLNHEKQYYLGHPVRLWSTIYNMGQAGYVLSKGTLDAFKKKFKEADSCTKMGTYRNQEDYYLGQSLASLNITPVDTRDEKGLSTFHPYNLYHVFFPKNNNKLSVFPHKCCSPHTIAFQGIEGDKMYTYYYLLYTVQLFHYGVLGNKPPFKEFTDDKIWKNFLKERQISENISAEQYYKIWENIVDDPTSFARHMKREEYFDYL